MIDLRFDGRHAVVCGSTRGIGRATAELFALQGARVTLLARDQSALDEVLESLPGNEEHEAFAVDFNNPEKLEQLLKEEKDHFSTATILVNNSGGPPAGLAVDASPESFRTAFERHLVSSQLLVQALVPGMKQASHGRILNVISTSVKSPIPGLGVSNTIRGAVANWAKTLSVELGPFGVTVNNILPGATATGRLSEIIENKASKSGKTVKDIEEAMKAEIPAGRFAKPAETAAAILFLASDAASYINGINLPVDGGRLSCL
jgi:3-oxoacyl-[acyl-carrier protein] reductase